MNTDKSTTSKRTRRVRHLPWFAIIPVALSLALGVWGIQNTTLWFDEIMTLFASSWPLYHLWEAPLVPYYFLMYGWTLTGDFAPDWWLRLSSVVAAAVAIGLTAIAAKMLVNRRIGLVAGLLLALMPGVTRYAQEARVYAFAMLLVSIATLIFLYALRDQRRLWWVLYALSLATIGVFAPFAYAVVPAHAVLLSLDQGNRKLFRPWLFSCLSNIPVLVVLSYFALRYSSLHGWVEQPTLGDLPTALPLIALNTTFGWILVTLSVLSRESAKWLMAVGAGIVALWVISLGPSSFWIQRSMLPLAPLLAIAAAIALSRAKWPAIISVISVLGIVAWPSYIADRQPDARGTNAHRTVDLVDKYGQEGDVISTAINFGFSWSVEHYLPGDERFEFAPSSKGRIWVTEPKVNCDRIAEFQIAPDSDLILCKDLPPEWDSNL